MTTQIWPVGEALSATLTDDDGDTLTFEVSTTGLFFHPQQMIANGVTVTRFDLEQVRAVWHVHERGIYGDCEKCGRNDFHGWVDGEPRCHRHMDITPTLAERQEARA